MARLDDLDLLNAIDMALICDEWFLERLRVVQSSQPEDYWGLDKNENSIELQRDLSYTVWMIRLSRNEIKSVISRLRIPVYLADIILAANRLWSNQSEFIDVPASVVLERLSDEPTLAVYGFYLSVNNENVREAIRNYVVDWQYITLSTDGNDLKEMGIPPGPIYSKILKRMKAGRLDGIFENEAEEKKYLEQVLDTIEDDN
jgi:tRNA nucleotidyltransferase (CCA-adding enzyme)